MESNLRLVFVANIPKFLLDGVFVFVTCPCSAETMDTGRLVSLRALLPDQCTQVVRAARCGHPGSLCAPRSAEAGLFAR